MNIRDAKLVESQDLDQLVRDTYKRPFCFQQQDGCRDRDYHEVTVPGPDDDFPAESIPEVVNGEEIGVSFSAWLARDPESPVGNRTEQFAKDLFWERSFYPGLGMVMNDLHARGLIPAGDYVISIDW